MTALLLAISLLLAPQAEIGTALEAGVATYCAPTPTHCQNWGGDAHLGAVPSFRYGDAPYVVKVCHEGRCTNVTVVSYCACGDRNGKATVIDLSPAAFQDLAPLHRGVIPVTVEYGGGVAPTLPPTNTEDAPATELVLRGVWPI